MIDIFRSDSSGSSYNILSLEKSLYDDFLRWKKLFIESLVDRNKSANTIKSYEFTLNLMLKYIKKNYAELKSIKELDSVRINLFLEVLEDLKNSQKSFTSVRDRVELLSIVLNKINSFYNLTEFIDLSEEYINNEVDEPDKDIFFLACEEFSEYYEVNKNVINNDYISSYYDFLLSKRSSVSTMKQRVSVIKSFLVFIEKRNDENFSFSNTFEYIKLYKSDKDISFGVKDKSLTQKEILFFEKSLLNWDQEFSSYLQRSSKKNKILALDYSTMALTLLYTGMRADELLNLKRVKVEFKAEMIVMKVLGKGSKYRNCYIDITDRQQYVKKLQSILKRNIHSKYVFTSHSNQPYKYAIVLQSIVSIAQKSGIVLKGLHTLRHCFGSTFINNGGTIELLRDLLGHSSYQTTNIYAVFNERSKENAIKSFARARQQEE